MQIARREIELQTDLIGFEAQELPHHEGLSCLRCQKVEAGFESDPELLYAIDGASGHLSLVNRQPIGPIPPHFSIALDGSHLEVANYVGGRFHMLPIAVDGSLGPIADELRQTGSGIVFVINELAASITAIRFNPHIGQLSPVLKSVAAVPGISRHTGARRQSWCIRTAGSCTAATASSLTIRWPTPSARSTCTIRARQRS